MRISSFQRKAILDSVAVEFEQDIRVTLFGSRVNDFSRGGDIDLFVEIPCQVDDILRKKLSILSRIQRKIGEQKIDLIITYPGEFRQDNLPLVIKEARDKGVVL
jgi:predicted nucleotidyltransferase